MKPKPVDVVCSQCGSTADGGGSSDGDAAVAPLGWSAEIIETSDGRRPRWVCTDCTRRFVRSIEGKLDHDWW